MKKILQPAANLRWSIWLASSFLSCAGLG